MMCCIWWSHKYNKHSTRSSVKLYMDENHSNLCYSLSFYLFSERLPVFFMHSDMFCCFALRPWRMYWIIVVALKGSTWQITCQPTPLSPPPSMPPVIITSIQVLCVWWWWYVLHKLFFTSFMSEEVSTNIDIRIFRTYGTSCSIQISMQINSAIPQNFLQYISIFNAEARSIWLY